MQLISTLYQPMKFTPVLLPSFVAGHSISAKQSGTDADVIYGTADLTTQQLSSIEAFVVNAEQHTQRYKNAQEVRRKSLNDGKALRSLGEDAHKDDQHVPLGPPDWSLAIQEESHGAALVWSADLTVGSPAQGPWRIRIDTGKLFPGQMAGNLNIVIGRFFAFATSLTGSDFCWVGHQYEPTKSTKSVDTKKDFTYGYITSNITGRVFRDTFSIGMASLPNQTFGRLSGDGPKGLLGFAPQPHRRPSDPLAGDTLFTSMLKTHAVHTDIFAASHSPAQGALLDMGGVRREAYTGDISWAPEAKGLHDWMAEGTTLNGVPLQPVTVDTGSWDLSMAVPTMRKLCEQLKGQVIQGRKEETGVYLCGFRSLDEVPAIVFTVGGGSFTLNKFTLNRGPVGDHNVTLRTIGWTGMNDLNLTVFGIPFLHSVYTIFNGSNSMAPTLGFAQLIR